MPLIFNILVLGLVSNISLDFKQLKSFNSKNYGGQLKLSKNKVKLKFQNSDLPSKYKFRCSPFFIKTKTFLNKNCRGWNLDVYGPKNQISAHQQKSLKMFLLAMPLIAKQLK